MPIFKNRTTFEIMRGITAFLNLDTGLVRGEAPNPEVAKRIWEERLAQQRTQLQQARAQLAKQRGQLEQHREWLEKKNERITQLEATQREAARGVDPENMVWIFGTIRTGSTWLGSMMGGLKGHTMWNEPRVGELFGHYYYEKAAHRRENNNFIMGLQRKLSWLKSIRTFVLDSVAEKYPKLTKNSYLVIKEPSGSVGAPLLMEALPESRMIFLIRDPRDVVASALDTAKEGSWAYQLKGNKRRREARTGNTDGEYSDGKREKESEGSNKRAQRLVKRQAEMYARDIGNTKQAYEAHQGPKVLVRYEDLRANTLAQMNRIYSKLEIEVEGEDLERVVEEHSWEKVPEEEKGPGKFKRKATPGGWREDLTPEQVDIVERITASLLEEFYPEKALASEQQ
jgi:hypothetical protein